MKWVWTQFLMIHLKRLPLVPAYFPSLKYSARYLQSLHPEKNDQSDGSLKYFQFFLMERIVESPKKCSRIFTVMFPESFLFRAAQCELSCFLLSPPLYDAKVNFPAWLTSDSNWWIGCSDKRSDCYCFWCFRWTSIRLYRGWLDRPYWFHKQIHSIPHLRSRTQWDKYE